MKLSKFLWCHRRTLLVGFIFIWQMWTLWVLMTSQAAQQVLTLVNSSSLSSLGVGLPHKDIKPTKGSQETLQRVWSNIVETGLSNRSRNVNVTRSNQIPLQRSIPDTRPAKCKGASYDLSSLPKASVVIPFYQEPLSLLLRTVQSVLDRTPSILLKEVVLVDDASNDPDLDEPLEKYLSVLDEKVKLLRNFQREGLIRSRLRGMYATKADVLVFLDAHIEVNDQWLEPMLYEIQQKPNTVVQPFVDGIDMQTLEYSAPSSPLFTGSFTWDLRYVWVQLADHIERAAVERGQPYWSATLVGCAMAVSKSYFTSIGGFDPDQLIWGGENLELSFRVWMCGGTVLTTPCARVGHVFRPTPYSGETIFQEALQKNLIRTAEVWMGDFKKYYYGSSVMYTSSVDGLSLKERQSLQERIKVKEGLKCKSFQWYLMNIAPDVVIPPRHTVLHGEIANKATTACWEVLSDGYIILNYLCWRHKVIAKNIFSLTSEGLLMHGDQCVGISYPNPSLSLRDCPVESNLGDGLWNFIGKGVSSIGQIQVKFTVGGVEKVFCIEHVTSAVEPHVQKQMPQIHNCEGQEYNFQIWSFTYRFDLKGWKSKRDV